MGALLVAVLGASLLGSLHCVGMCGPFAAFAFGLDPLRADRSEPAPALGVQLAYHGGRLCTYAALGAVAGGLGAAVDLGGQAVGIARAAAAFAGGFMVLFGLVSLARLRGWRLPQASAPAAVQRLAGAIVRRAGALSPTRRALAMGLATTLLPCGWLYAFAVTAAGTGSPLGGALTMAVFWIGTLPALTALGLGVRRLSAAWGRRMPVATALVLIVAGSYTAFSRGVHAHALASGSRASGATPATPAAVERVRNLPDAAMPCCHDEGG